MHCAQVRGGGQTAPVHPTIARSVRTHAEIGMPRTRAASVRSSTRDCTLLCRVDLDLIVVEHRTVPEIRLSLRRGLIRVRVVARELPPPYARRPHHPFTDRRLDAC